MKKRSNKVLLLTGLATVTIGAAGILHTNYMQPPQIGLAKTQTYNYHPNNILDNVFEQDNVKYLPFIFESPNQKITKEFITSEFAKKGLTITSQLNAVVGTGTKITVRENNTVYTVVVYGDVNGNGEVNLVDAQLLILHYRKTQTITQKANLIAGNVSNDNGNSVINLVDAQRVIMFKKESKDLDKLVVKEPASIKETDKTAPVITILGQSQVTLEEGDSYTDQGATAKDNYDGDVTAEISTKIQFVANGSSQIQTVGQVDTSKVGTYTIIYTVSDSNGNTATATRTVTIKEKEIVIPPTVQVTKIELLNLPENFKTTYQYGENLDLTDVQIKVYKDDGTTNWTEIKPVTKDMVSEYTLTTAGERNITVTYSNKLAEATIDVTVLNKISELVITNEEMNGITENEADDTYNIISQEEFTLGEIKAGEGTSTLKLEQLKWSENALSISKEEKDGKILIKGTAPEAKVYTIKLYIQYDNEKVEKEITLVTKKDDTVKTIEFNAANNELINYGKTATRDLVFKNKHGETLDIPSNKLIISTSNGINITRLALDDRDQEYEIDANASDDVRKLRIGTNLEVGGNFTVTMKINGQEEEEFPFTITTQDKSVLNDIKLDETKLTLYTSAQDNMELDENGNIYTYIAPTFIDQYENESFQITEEDIVYSKDEEVINNAVEQGKLGILLPEVNWLNRDGKLLPTKSTIDVSYNLLAGEIGFGIRFDKSTKLDLRDLNSDKQVILKYQHTATNPATQETTITIKEKTLKIEVVYEETKELVFGPSSDLTLENDCYVTTSTEEVTLGILKVGEREEPLIPDMLTTDIITENGTMTEEQAKNEDIIISYVKENNHIVVKVTVIKPDVKYQIKPKIKKSEATIADGINIKRSEILDIQEILIDNFSVETNGGQTEKQLVVKSNLFGELTEIKAGEISFEQKEGETPVNYLNIERLDSNGNPIDPDTEPGTIVKKIRITSTVATEKEMTLKIILFEGRTDVTGNKSKEITVTIAKLLPTDIKLGKEGNSNNESIVLYDEHQDGITETVGSMEYTLVPIKLLSNREEINNTNDLFTTEESDKQDKVYIKCPIINKRIRT